MNQLHFMIFRNVKIILANSFKFSSLLVFSTKYEINLNLFPYAPPGRNINRKKMTKSEFEGKYYGQLLSKTGQLVSKS